MATTKWSFTYANNDLFDKVKVWAAEKNYKIKKSDENFIHLQRGNYLSYMAHPSLIIKRDNNEISMEAWITPIWGGKLDISGDGAMGYAAKMAARSQINALLDKLGQKLLI